jgi:membrane fusion protein, multidrug efflux system
MANVMRRHPSTSMRRLKSAIPLLFLLVATLPLHACGKTAKARAQRVSVTVARAERRDVPLALTSTGTVEPIQSAAVGSQVGGVVTRIAFHEGDEVRAGQLLFQLDPRPFRAALAQAQATLAKSRAQAESARLDADRAKALFDRSMVSQMEWDQKRTTAAALAATARSDSASMEKARLDLDYSSIRAPVGGRTGRLMIHQGDYVKAASADPLVTVNQSRPVRVAFTVPGTDVPLVQRYRATGTPRVWVTTSDTDSATMEGRLSFVDNMVDASSGTLLLKGEFPNRDLRLIPGQFVTVRLVLTVEPRATVVPSPAISRGQQGAFVYVVNRDSTVSPRPVHVSRTVDEMSVVTSGLDPGEQVVTDGQLRLSPGARVVFRDGGAANREGGDNTQ